MTPSADARLFSQISISLAVKYRPSLILPAPATKLLLALINPFCSVIKRATLRPHHLNLITHLPHTMLSKFFLALGLGIITLTHLTAALRQSLEINAESTPSSGNFFEEYLYNDMLTLADNGLNGRQLYRVDTAHAYTWFSYQYANGMTFAVGGPHDFSLWAESVEISGHLAGGSLVLGGKRISISNALFRDNFVSTGRYNYGDYELRGNGLGWLSILPTMWPPTDGFIISSFDWRNLVQFPSVHLYARRNTSTVPGVLRFGGPRPFEHGSLNTTSTPDECWAISGIISEPDQNATSFRYAVQVDTITHNKYGIYDSIVNLQGYQIDTVSLCHVAPG